MAKVILRCTVSETQKNLSNSVFKVVRPLCLLLASSPSLLFLHCNAVLLVSCATTKASVSNHTHTKLGTSVTINPMNRSPINPTRLSAIQESPRLPKTEVSFSRSQQTSAHQYRNQQGEEPSPSLKIQFNP